MGTYTAQDFIATFGGLPEPGEAAIDINAMADERRVEAREQLASCACGGTGQIHHNASGDDSVHDALSFYRPCRDPECIARRDAEFMGGEIDGGPVR